LRLGCGSQPTSEPPTARFCFFKVRFCRVPFFARVFRLFLAAYPSYGTRVPPDRNLSGTSAEHALPSPPLLLGKYLDSFYFDFPHIFTKSIPLIILGTISLLCGTILAVYTIFLFKTIGQGTPNPKLPPKKFVVVGPYRFSRNPMAFGGLLILLGEAAIYYSPSLLGIALLYGLVIYESVRKLKALTFFMSF
jgi:protein-S-isoprenylcysteine O-methyltransferase Ste14